MDTNTLESNVGRRKEGEAAKVRCTYTLVPESPLTLERLAKETGLNMSQLVDLAIRQLDESGVLAPFKRSAANEPPKGGGS